MSNTLAFDKSQVHATIDASPPWWKVPSLIRLYSLLLAAMVTSSSWGFDLSMTNGLQSVSHFTDYFDNPQGARLGFYGASTSVGGIIATFVGGYLVDRFGRRALCFAGAIIVIGMAIMQTFSTTFNMFIAAKLILGFGANLQQIGGPVLVTELAHPKQRVFLSSLYNSSIYIGFIIGAWITYGTYAINSNWSWKIPCILQIMLPTYQAATIWFCPESPRWLVSRGRIEEARRILIKYHGNGVEDEVVADEIREIVAGVQADRTQLKLNAAGIHTILGNKGNLRRLWICFIVGIGSRTAGSNLISAYLPQILDQVGITTSKEKTLINGIQTIWQWIVAIIAAFIVPRVKRRSLFLFSTTGMTASFVVWTALTAQYIATGHAGLGKGVIAVIFIYNTFYSLCWLPLVVAYPVELATTKQRGLFFSFTLFSINASSFVFNYISPIGLANIGWKFYIIQSLFDATLVVIIYFTFVETKGLTLEEVAIVFDGEGQFDHAATEVETDMAKRTGSVQMAEVKKEA